jgi:hypothetical protein
MDQLEDHICPACGRFFSTIKGVHSHLTSSRKCGWYKKGMLKQVPTHVRVAENDIPENTDVSDDLDIFLVQETYDSTEIDPEMDPEDVVEEMGEFFQFIPLPEPLLGDEHPARSSGSHSHKWTSIHLEEEDNQYVEIPCPDAGFVFGVDESLHSKWKRHFGHQEIDEEGDVTMQDGMEPLSSFAPFASELDWRVALWAIKDGIGHKSFDRLLAIPGVSSSCWFRNIANIDIKVMEKLGLSYKNIRGLHKILDNSIPSRAPWKHHYLSFKDSPEEKHLVQFRDPILAIQSLLSNPAHAQRMVFTPRKVYTSKSKEHRIYNEMWTGRWWNAVQVS